MKLAKLAKTKKNMKASNLAWGCIMPQQGVASITPAAVRLCL